MHPSPHTYEDCLTQQPNFKWILSPLKHLALLSNQPKRHIYTLYFEIFTSQNQDINHTPTTNHNKLYDFIHQQSIHPMLHHLQKQFPYLPKSLIL